MPTWSHGRFPVSDVVLARVLWCQGPGGGHERAPVSWLWEGPGRLSLELRTRKLPGSTVTAPLQGSVSLLRKRGQCHVLLRF